MTDMREEFESIYIPSSTIYWDESSQEYKAKTGYAKHLAEKAQEALIWFNQGKQAARTGGELEPFAWAVFNTFGDPVLTREKPENWNESWRLFSPLYTHPTPPTVVTDWEGEYNLLHELAEEIRESFADGHPTPVAAVPDKLTLHDVGDYIIPEQQIERLRFQQGWNTCREEMLTATPQPVGESEKLPEFLIEMSKQMREQPSRMTAHPFWQVRCNRYLPTLEGYNEHHVEICGDEGVVFRVGDDLSELHEHLIECHEDWCRQWAAYEHEEEDWEDAIRNYYDPATEELPDALRKVPVQEVEEVVSTHLTQAGAEQFIARKQHDYPKLFTYVESAYWSPQLRELQDWIISLSAQPPEGER